jgi:hypothetical protein
VSPWLRGSCATRLLNVNGGDTLVFFRAVAKSSGGCRWSALGEPRVTTTDPSRSEFSGLGRHIHPKSLLVISHHAFILHADFRVLFGL